MARRWKYDEEAQCIREDDAGGLALFEVLSATTPEQAKLAANAAEMADALSFISVTNRDYTSRLRARSALSHGPDEMPGSIGRDIPDVLTALGALIEHAAEAYPHFEGPRGQADIAAAIHAVVTVSQLLAVLEAMAPFMGAMHASNTDELARQARAAIAAARGEAVSA